MQENKFDPLTQNLEKENDIEQHKNNEFVFRFPLNSKICCSNPNDTLRVFFRDQIRDLLKIVSFSKDGKKLLPNEFKFLNDPNKAYPIFDDD